MIWKVVNSQTSSLANQDWFWSFSGVQTKIIWAWGYTTLMKAPSLDYRTSLLPLLEKSKFLTRSIERLSAMALKIQIEDILPC